MKLDARADRSRKEVVTALGGMSAATRGDLQNATGLGASTVASVVRTLIAEGVVRELSTGQHRGPGRPASRLVLDDLPGHVVGIDIGHRHVAVALATAGETVIDERWAVNDGTLAAGELLGIAATLVGELLESSAVEVSSVLHGVVCVPAPVEPSTGYVPTAPIIVDAWRGTRPGHELTAALGIPVTAANDANAGAIGERVHGVGRGVDDFVYLNATIGIGAGLILGGRLYSGPDGAAGEIGHIRLPGAFELCRCGQHGCLESEASVAALTPKLAAVGVHVPTGGGLGEVLEQNAEHPAVRRLITQAGRGLGSVLADICNLLSPSLVIVGGELSAGGPAIRDGIVESLQRYALSTISSTVRVDFSSLGARSQVLGAVALAATAARSRARFS